MDLQVEGHVPCYHKYINSKYTVCLNTVAGNVEVNLKVCEKSFFRYALCSGLAAQPV